jgi:hypothetical protein
MVHRPNVDSWREAAIPDPGACPMAPCPYAPALYRPIRSVSRRARPPSSGRSTRQRRNVKRSRRPPGATRRVPGRSPASARHPEHGEAGRGQRLIAHTRQEHPVAPWSVHRTRDALPARAFLPFSQIVLTDVRSARGIVAPRPSSGAWGAKRGEPDPRRGARPTIDGQDVGIAVHQEVMATGLRPAVHIPLLSGIRR